MLIEHQEFNLHTGPPSNGQDDTIFRYCNFADLAIEGNGLDGALIDPLAILLIVPATNVSAAISHWGADVNGVLLNYIFVTPEVHRWHHSAKIPDGHKYSVNYGVEFAFWDILFGTYHLPQEGGLALQPERIADWATSPTI